jgi:photosystem II stability/assembly factor-like uncharacterized protein
MRPQSHFLKKTALIVVSLFLTLAMLPAQPLTYPSTQEKVSPLADQTWVRLGGPIGGLGYDIRIRPDNPEIMYVTDAWAGVHKSEDGGQTWFTLNEGIEARTGPSGDAIPVFCLTIDPNNHDILWIGLQSLGAVYRSDNGGETWQKRINGIAEREGLTIRGIAVESGNSDVVYIAGEVSSWIWAGRDVRGREFERVRGVVYKTTNGGNTWRAVWRGDSLARYILIHPDDPDILYLSTGLFDREAANSDPATNRAGGEGILKSTDGGQSWVHINNGLRNFYIGSLFMSSHDPDTLLAGTGNNAYRGGGGVYLTTNGGITWRHVAGDHITSVEFSQSNAKIAYAAGDGTFFRSEDGGITWKSFVHKRGWGWGPDGIRPGFPIDFQVDPRDPYRIFVNNYGGGNFLSIDGGKNWITASEGYTGADLRDVFVLPDNPAYVLANGRSGPFLSRDGGVNWQGINPLDLRVIAEGARIVVNPSDPDHILLSSAHWGWTYESVNSGKTWRLVTNYEAELGSLPVPDVNEKFQGFQAIAFAPSDPKIVYGGFGIWRCAADANRDMCRAKSITSVLLSENGGRTWKRLTGTPFNGLTVSEIVIHPENTDSAWVATVGGGIFHTEDRGQTWSARNSGLGSMFTMDIALDPSNAGILYAGTNDRGVFKSEDGGETWKGIRTGMDSNEPVYAVVVDPAHPQVVFAGSFRSGIFLSEDGGARWKLLNDGLTTRAITSLSITHDGETLFAGTRGGGVFRLSIHDQAYFDALGPTPTAIPPTIAPTQAATETPIVMQSPITTSTPVQSPTSAPPATPICPSAAIVIAQLGGVLALQGRRRIRK